VRGAMERAYVRHVRPRPAGCCGSASRLQFRDTDTSASSPLPNFTGSRCRHRCCGDPMTDQNPNVDLGAIIKPGNAQAVLAALVPAWSIDAAGIACIVPYSFNMETLLVAHVASVPGAGASSLDVVRSFLDFIADVRAKVGATWLPVYSCFDATKDRTVADRF